MGAVENHGLADEVSEENPKQPSVPVFTRSLPVPRPYGISDALISLYADTVENCNHAVIFVDDECDTLRAYEVYFRRTYNVITAESADEAIRAIAALAPGVPPRVIVSDQRMPGRTGVDFFTDIRQKYPTTVRILITGYTDIVSVERAINQAHVYKYLHKPLPPDELAVTLREAVALSILMSLCSCP